MEKKHNQPQVHPKVSRAVNPGDKGISKVAVNKPTNNDGFIGK